MRIATWNIRAGGGKRIELIAQTIIEASPDILVLTEYRHTPGRRLLDLISNQSYQIIAGEPDGAQNCTCVLSRFPLKSLHTKHSPVSLHRWVAFHIPEPGLNILGVHVPNQSKVWNKREFWDCIESFSNEYVTKRSVIIGDLNTALDEDCEGDPIREAVYFNRLLAAGWIDVWRKCNPDVREFSWYSHRQNGFRLDHCLVSPPLSDSVTEASYRHDVRTQRLSDHSMLTVDLTI